MRKIFAAAVAISAAAALLSPMFARGAAFHDLQSDAGKDAPVVVPAARAVASAAAPIVATGIRGTVVMQPTCGGPIRPGRACSKPMGGVTLSICPADQRRLRCVDVTTDANGAFLEALPVGKYRVTGEQRQVGIRPQTPSVEVDVVDGAIASVEVAYDTGIR